VEFVVDKVARGYIFSEYFGFPANLHSTKFSILTITRGRHNRPEMADMPIGTSLNSTPHYENKKIKKIKKKKKASRRGNTDILVIFPVVSCFLQPVL
jgi:hypothetical protein